MNDAFSAISATLDALPNPYILIRDGRVIWANGPTARLLGYDRPEHLTEYLLLEHIRPSDQQRMQALQDEVAHTKAPLQIKLAMQHRRGTAISVRVQLGHVQDDIFVLSMIAETTQPISWRPSVEHIPVGVYRLDPQGEIIYANEALINMLGYSNEGQLLGLNLRDLIAYWVDLDSLNKYWRESVTQIQEVELRCADSRIIYARDTARAFFNAEGALLYVDGSLENISQQKTQEADLRTQNQELEALYSISRSMGKSLELNETLSQLLNTMGDVIPFDSASITLFVDDSRPEFLAAVRLPENVTIEKIAYEIRNTNYTEIVRERQQSIIVPDVHADPYWHIIPGTEYIRSWLGVPIMHHGHTIGMLNIDHTQSDFFTVDHAHKATMIAQQAAITISNALLYGQAQSEIHERRRTEQNLRMSLRRTNALYEFVNVLIINETLAESLDTLLNIVMRALDCEGIRLIIYDRMLGMRQYDESVGAESPDWESLRLLSEIDLQPDHMPEADLNWPQGQQISLPDGQHLMGTVVDKRGLLLAHRHQHRFSDEDRALLVTFANQLSIAHENSLLYTRLRNYTEELEVVVKARTSELQLEQGRLQAILDATGEGIIYMEDDTLLYANPAFYKMLGYSEDSTAIVGKQLKQIRRDGELPQDPQLFLNLMKHTSPGQVRRDMARLLHEDGSLLQVSLAFTHIGDIGETPVRIVAVARDLSQEQALQTQRSRFISNAAHELRTPLTSFGLRLHMLRRQPERLEMHLDHLDRVSTYIRHLVEELLDLTRFEKGSIVLQQEAVDLHELAERSMEAQKPYAQQKGVTLRHNIPQNEPLIIQADIDRILQVMNNLIINGINYSGNGDEVEIEIHETQYEGRAYVCIKVMDMGGGISADLLPSQIFEPFSRPSMGDQNATGLGLALVREIIALHGGIVDAQLRPTGGSILQACIPVLKG